MSKLLIDEATVKLALEALEGMQNAIYNIGGEHVIDLNCAVEKADVAEQPITALREALTSVPDWASEAKEQPAPVAKPHEQEPVAKDNSNYRLDPPGLDPLYTTPQAQRKPLTDDEIRGLTPKPDGVAESDPRRVEVLPGVMGTEYDEVDAWSMPLVLQIARAIEAAHGIKENT